MRLKTLRTAVATFALAAAIPITMTPAEARVMLSQCERWAWADCEAEWGNDQINDPEFAACFAAKQQVYCPAPVDPPFPLNPILDCTKTPGDPRCPALPPPPV